jgi:hypothetical protein
MKVKVISGGKVDFEDKLERFIQPLDSYSVQYKPVVLDRLGYSDNKMRYTALVIYAEPTDE